MGLMRFSSCLRVSLWASGSTKRHRTLSSAGGLRPMKVPAWSVCRRRLRQPAAPRRDAAPGQHRQVRLVHEGHENPWGSLYSTETGSLSQTSDWDFDPANRTPEAYDALRRATDEILPIAVENTLSSSTNHTLSMFATALRPALHFSEYNSPHLQMLMDPTNWFNNDMLDAETVTSTLQAGFEAEKGLFHLAHAKDVAPPTAEAPGNRHCRGRGKACSTIPSMFAYWMRLGIPVRSSLSTLPRARCRRRSALSVLSFLACGRSGPRKEPVPRLRP